MSDRHRRKANLFKTGLWGGVLLALLGCHATAPKGQVLAIVGDQEVTVQDVDAEARASKIAHTPATEPVLLERVIARDLLAQSARRQRLDRTPQAPSDLARLQQAWLAEQAVARLDPDPKPPTDAQVRAFISVHPNAFAERTRYRLERLMAPSSPAMARTLESYPGLDAAAAFLKRLGVPVERRTAVIDSALLPPPAAAQLAATPDHKLVTSYRQGRLILNEIAERAHITTPEPEQMALARQMLQQGAISDRVAGEVRRLKSQIPVHYASGAAASDAPGSPQAPAAGA